MASASDETQPDGGDTGAAAGHAGTLSSDSLADNETEQLSRAAYAGYYLVLFVAYWFGSNRFDYDGDGDFDAEDVHAFLQNKGLIKKRFRRKKKHKKKEDSETDKKLESSESGQGPDAPSEAGQDQEIEPKPAQGLHHHFAAGIDGDIAVEDEVMANLLERQVYPWFIIVQCFVCFALWFIWSMVEVTKEDRVVDSPLGVVAGFDTFFPGKTDLRLFTGCNDDRAEIWRWFTYQWTHVGAMHVVMNVFLNIVLGVPLEGLHGHLTMFIMYNVGVMGGALCYFVNDAHTVVVGCSGGCYALIGMHISDLLMNWAQKKFRFPTLVLIALLIGLDTLTYFTAVSNDHASHSAHFGGAVAGFCVGVLLGKNLRVSLGDKFLMLFFTVLGFGLMIFCIVWMAVQEAPLNIWEAAKGENGYCWIRQIWAPLITEEVHLCVRCGDQVCIDHWTSLYGSDMNVARKPLCAKQGWYHDGR